MNLNLNPSHTAVYPKSIFKFSEKLNKILIPIGFADKGQLVILKDLEHKIYCIDGFLLFYVSNSLGKAIEIFSNSNTSLPRLKRIVELD